MAEAFDAVETNLRLIGTTGIEDKLQDGVPETISALREAGIQVFLLKTSQLCFFVKTAVIDVIDHAIS